LYHFRYFCENGTSVIDTGIEISTFGETLMIEKSQISMEIQKDINLPNPPLKKGVGGFSSNYAFTY
jgi:hypothetical protein